VTAQTETRQKVYSNKFITKSIFLCDLDKKAFYMPGVLSMCSYKMGDCLPSTKWKFDFHYTNVKFNYQHYLFEKM